METVFERDALFAKVWSSPITTLAKKYKLSDNGLRKVCKAMAIPLPPRGYWQKLAAGHTLEVPKLQPTTAKTRFVSHAEPHIPSKAEIIAIRVAKNQAEAKRQRELNEAKERQTKEILAEVAAWKQAEDIRAYRQHLVRAALTSGVFLTRDLQLWLGIAEIEADELDPTKKRIG